MTARGLRPSRSLIFRSRSKGRDKVTVRDL